MENKRFEEANKNWTKYLIDIMTKYKIPQYDILKLDDLHHKCIVGALEDAEEKLLGGE